MSHLPDLIKDLVLILGAAACVTLLFRKLKQPLVLGYILAGFLVGPHVHFFPTVRETGNIQIWAEIGVIFLLFSLGLEFSFKKLVKVGGSASITAIVEVVIMLAIGYGAGRILGWNNMDSLFLGGILSISSTTIIIRAFDELGMKTHRFVTLVFGVLIVEDLVAIVLLVLLSTLAVSREFEGTEMIMSIMKLAFFLAIWFLAGIFIIPTFLRRIKKLLTDEMLLILSISLCLLMVWFADSVGFSPALGAFIMGSILAETTKAEKIEHLIKPVKDLFAAIFFVSVGMLIDPQILGDYAIPVVILCIVTILGKILSTSFGALLSGQTLQTSLQTGFSLAQIGEFSFIIATLGLTLKVTSEFLYPIAVAVSAVTTLTTPYLIKSSIPFYHWFVKKVPPGFLKRLNTFSAESRSISASSEWSQYLKTTLFNVLLFSGVIISIIILSSKYVLPWVRQHGNSDYLNILTILATFLVLLPFLWALAVRNSRQQYAQVVNQSKYNRAIALVRILRVALAAFFIGFLLDQFFSFSAGIVGTSILLTILLILSKRIQSFYNRIERRFVSNLNQREIAEAISNREELAPWDARITPVIVEHDSYCVGKSLTELRWREAAGINVVMIKRGDHQLPVPDKNEIIFPGDQLLVLGTDLQIKKLQALIRHHKPDASEKDIPTEIGLHTFALPASSKLVGKTIRETGLREKHQGLVVGVERQGHRILNPESGFTFQPGDIVFVVGVKREIRILFQ
jgi:CPA2 family monovalent cation:H+ antiporter-2